jgi:hypothetical protein
LSPSGSGYFTCIKIWGKRRRRRKKKKKKEKKKKKKKVTKKFKSGRLHEGHVVATWKLGNHVSIRL